MPRIKFWKNVGDERFKGKEFEIFKASFDDEKGILVRDDENGDFWAIYEPEPFVPKTVRRLFRDLDFYGEVIDDDDAQEAEEEE